MNENQFRQLSQDPLFVKYMGYALTKYKEMTEAKLELETARKLRPAEEYLKEQDPEIEQSFTITKVLEKVTKGLELEHEKQIKELSKRLRIAKELIDATNAN